MPDTEQRTKLIEAGFGKVTRDVLTIVCTACDKHFYVVQFGSLACPYCGRRTEQYETQERER